METTNINSIKFGILSADEIRSLSVCSVNNSKLSNTIEKKNIYLSGDANDNSDSSDEEVTIYNEKMGILLFNKICPTCNEDVKNCTGHFGHIELNSYIIHPLFVKYVLMFLKCFCSKCFSLILTKDSILLSGFMKYKGHSRFEHILEKSEKKEQCGRCKALQPKYMFSVADSTIMSCYKKRKGNMKLQVSVEEIKRIFDGISNADIVTLGLNPAMVHPKNFILCSLPVLPPISRPYIITDGMTYDDDLTVQYTEIIKKNNYLADKKLTPTMFQKYNQALKFRIKTLFDNSLGKARHTNGRPYKGIKERISGKGGILRENLLGKRVDGSGRTVISPDPTLKLGEIGIPEKMAQTLMIPVKVCAYNIDYLSKLIEQDKVSVVITQKNETIRMKYATKTKGSVLYKGDSIIRNSKIINNIDNIILKEGDIIVRADGKEEEAVISKRKKYTLNIGDRVERQIMDGDIVILNRQPTLHVGSMMAHRVIVQPYKTIRTNLCVTRSYNSDFDGDEMNIHVTASPLSEAELDILSNAKRFIISPQASKPNIVIVQDSLLGAYLLTKKNTIVPRERFFNLCMSVEIKDIKKKFSHVQDVYAEKGIPFSYSGKALFSMILPDDLIYVKDNKDPEEPILEIYKGVVLKGVMNKIVLGNSFNSLIQIMYKEYSIEITSTFINNTQYLTNNWLVYHSFSIGIEDCIPYKKNEIEDAITKSFLEAKGIENMINHPGIREVKINSVLSKARDVGMKLAKDSLSKDNNFVATVTAGSKGDFFNIAQITGLLGQQNVGGERIYPSLNKGKRTLPHYPFKQSHMSEAKQFESRGFIKNSLIRGINPQEFWFHASSGREGLTDTAMKTADTGYAHRKLVKIMEDVQIKYDGTVRDAVGNLIQPIFGDSGLSGYDSVSVNGKLTFCDVNRIVNKLNLHHKNEKAGNN